ncbi:MAG: EAL domain-containing protein, partial [Pseudomonadota bacterium]
MCASPVNAAGQTDSFIDPDARLIERHRQLMTHTPWIAIITLSVLIAAGGATGWWVATQLQGSQTEETIQQSTRRVLDRLDDIIYEARLAFGAINDLGNVHCSEAQLRDMRTQLFEARYLRDIGGVRGFSLYCSTALGVLDQPYHSSPPPIRLPNGTGIRTDRAVLASQRLRTVVVEFGSFNALVDSRQVIDLVTGLEQAHIELAVDNTQQRDWHPYSLLTQPSNEEPSRRLQERVQCSETTDLCVRIRLGEDGAAAMDARTAVISGLGATLGASLFLIASGVRRQRNTPDRALARAIRDHRIRPYYQPIVQLPSGSLAGFEALARWIDEHGQTVPTEQFIALAERNGMIGDISALMIQSIGEDIGDWLAVNEELKLTLNVSPEEFCDPGLIRQIEEHLLERGIAPEQIVIEITERTMLETEAARDIIERMTKMGLSIYADDFGVGYCGLA